MIDWNALLQAIITSSIVATGLSIVFKAYIEKRIGYTFDKKLKEYETQLVASTELQTQISKDRIEEYKRLSALVSSARKNAVNLSERKDLKGDEISELTSNVKALETMVYDLSTTLRYDGIYGEVHSYKVQLSSLAKNFENEKLLREKGDSERLEAVRLVISRSIEDIRSESETIVEQLVSLIRPKDTV